MASVSPTPSAETMSLTSNSSEGEMEPSINTKCNLCTDTYTIPKVLSCFHTFCQPCLEKSVENMDKVICPDCRQETYLSSAGVAGLLPDFAVSNILEANVIDGASLHCTGCKSKDTNAVARCYDCANFLCANCVMAHQFMHCFEGHRVTTLTELASSKDDVKAEKPISCNKHKSELLRYFCKTCDIPICKECTVFEHAKGHEYDYLTEVAAAEVDSLNQLVEQAKVKANDLRGMSKSLEHSTNRLQIQYHKAENEIIDTYNFYRSMLEERKQDSMKELDTAFNAKQAALSTLAQRMQDAIERLYQGCEFIDKLLKHASSTEVLLFKKMLDYKMQGIISYVPDINTCNGPDLEFVSNYQAIQVGIRNTFGYIRQGPDVQPRPHPQPIARPNGFTSHSMPNGNTLPLESNLLASKQPQFSSNSSLTLPPPPPVVDPLLTSNQNLY